MAGASNSRNDMVNDPLQPRDLPGRERVRVSVIVPHYNDLGNLGECLRLLRAQTLPPDRFEVLVCDNNSTCGLAAVEAACGGFGRVVHAREQGAAEARNAGVAAAVGEVLAFIDSDCRPAADWLERGLAALGDADVAGGRIVVSVRDPARMTAAEAYERVFAFNNRRYVEAHHYSATANMFTTRTAFAKVGPFRAGVSEDRDWGERATRLGLRLRYADAAVVSHPARRDWAELARKWRRLTSESYALTCEQPYGRARWFARSFAVLLSPAVQAGSVLKSRELDSARDRAKAIYVLARLRIWRFVESQRKLLT